MENLIFQLQNASKRILLFPSIFTLFANKSCPEWKKKKKNMKPNTFCNLGLAGNTGNTEIKLHLRIFYFCSFL